MTYTWPTDEQMSQFAGSSEKDKPVTMLNLLKFHPNANYSDHPDEAPCSGKEAFARYEALVVPCFESYGARMIYSGNALATVIGPKEEQWDRVILVEYPSIQHMVDMLGSERYQSFVHHRAAATLDSRLLPMHTET